MPASVSSQHSGFGVLLYFHARQYSVFKDPGRRFRARFLHSRTGLKSSGEIPRAARSAAQSTSSALFFRHVVGLGRVELPTSPLSGVRSNQLSYRPSILVELIGIEPTTS